MSHYREFDFVVVNDHFERAKQELGEILDGGGAGLRSTRPELTSLIASLVR
jgi:guanylate kinase